MIIVLMGVAASGKTLIGQTLARQLGWPFFDADDFHSPENITRMSIGVPLSDVDREPWLSKLHQLLQHIDRAGSDAVLACSALRNLFRERLSERAGDLRFVYLKATRDTIAQRLASREDHFFSPLLLESQFDALEEPRGVLVVDASEAPDVIVMKIRAALGV